MNRIYDHRQTLGREPSGNLHLAELQSLLLEKAFHHTPSNVSVACLDKIIIANLQDGSQSCPVSCCYENWPRVSAIA